MSSSDAVLLAYPLALMSPLVLLALRLLRKPPLKAAPYPSTSHLASIPPSLRARVRAPLLWLTSFLTLVFLSFAAARPQRANTQVEPQERRNVMLALDISKSMETNDFTLGFRRVTRLDAVKHVLDSFIEKRTEDRLGLVVFGSSAFLQAPLTSDRQLVREMLAGLRPGMAGDGTAIGDGIGLSVKRIEGLPGRTKTIVLLTDGVSNSGQVNPVQAAKIASQLGIKVHTIGVGVPGSKQTTNDGRRADFDEETLREIARLTGGTYLHAQNIDQLTAVYEEIDRLEATSGEEVRHLVYEEEFPYYALLGFYGYAVYLLLSRVFFMRVP